MSRNSNTSASTRVIIYDSRTIMPTLTAASDWQLSILIYLTIFSTREYYTFTNLVQRPY
ncbi:hypothetical protein [Lysinibacillus fusiformis]|uniref:hypothetical protein n=1 Tax=Lysinibacillus fusiformis TaxID=28031 RepID=UPI00215B0953|nr:hypothetical protein [Lysinibacillus fusiformis]MCR8854919.1 hypothetical protein [Lysinibacillus fusiformis]